MKLKLKEMLARILTEQRNTQNMMMVKTFTYTSTAALAAKGRLAIKGEDIDYAVPSGYDLVGIRAAYASSTYINIMQFRLHATTGQFILIRNENESTAVAKGYTVTVQVIFVKAQYRA